MMYKRTLFAVLAVLLMPLLTTYAQDSAEMNFYTDSEDRYRIPVLNGWELSEQDELVTITGPDENITVQVLVLPLQDDIEQTIAAAWEQANPDVDRGSGEATSVPAPTGVEQRAAINYPVEERVVQAVGSLVDGQVYILLIDGDLAAVQRRAAQVNTIASGFEILAVQHVDLSDAEPMALDAAALEDIEAQIEELRTRFRVPGAAVAIVQNDEVIYTGGFGVKENGNEVPITPDTHMMIGSTGKSLTTTMMATMVDAGLFEWDTPVVEVLPEFDFSTPELTEQITMQNLVCACSGVPRRDLELFFNAENLSAEGVVESLETFELFTDFGETFQYSNQMVATGGYAAAVADGATFGNLFDGYAEALDARVLSPLGMENTTLSFEQVRQRDNYAQPHGLTFGFQQIAESEESGGEDVPAFDYRLFDLELERILEPVAPAGSHWSTVEDMARYMLMQMNDGTLPNGEQLVSADNLAVTREGQVAVSAQTDYGLGWFIDEYEGVRLIQHGGNTQGFSSSFGFLPDKNLGVVVLTNGQNTNSFGTQVRNTVFDVAFDNVNADQTEEEINFGLEQLTNFTTGPEGLALNTEADVIRPYLGNYENDALGTITIAEQGGLVSLDAGLFASTLLPIVDEESESARFVLSTPPLQGFPVAFSMDDDVPMITIGQGTFEYTFTYAE